MDVQVTNRSGSDRSAGSGRGVGRQGRKIAAVMVAAVLTTACTASGQATAIPADDRPGSVGATSLSALTAAPRKSCPLTTLPSAARAAGLTSSGDVTGTVEPISHPIQGLTGVAVDCSIHIQGGGSISVLLIAGQTGSAAVGLMPRLRQEGDVLLPAIQTVLTEAAARPPGSLVSIPGSTPVALRIVQVKGAASAAVLVAGDDGPNRSQVESFARALAHS